MTGDPVVEPASTDRGAERRDRLAGLLQDAREGRREAMNLIVADLTPLLWQAVRRQGLSRQAAEDAIQTTWLTLLRNLHSISAPHALIEWLLTTARREAWRVKAAGRDDELMGQDVFEEMPDADSLPEELLLQDERRRTLWNAVARLSQPCRDLMRLVAFVHRPHYDAVAASLGMPKGSIGPTRGRCLAKLRRLLAEDSGWMAP
ncbi:RNA polymerase sigma factor [Sphaerisporangium perillae]|uniref:RNA polymerase sigma factor n=1 Tax=Sphaerisporangium perillae TaxID=2935860 RepID=UPI00200C802C|nr:sigma-70 family RNA polymerase sigma factor [Sphaerisporangium perillae]